MTAGNFRPYVWIGNAERGIAFMADDDRGWVPDEYRDVLRRLVQSSDQLQRSHHFPEAFAQIRRGTLMLDGFVSVQAPYAAGEFTTKPLTFEGKELVMNFSTSAVGSVRVEIQDDQGSPVPGFSLADCPEIYGDAIEEVVEWKSGADVSALAGQTVRLRFVMKDADLYSLRFRE